MPAESINYLDMSDEDFQKTPFPPEEVEEGSTEENNTDDIEGKSDATIPEENADTEDPESDVSVETDSSVEGEKESVAQLRDSGERGEADEEDEITGLDYESEYKKLLTPFRANGKDLQVNSVEEARRLMQMGAGHIKYREELKPRLKLLKTLENHKLLDENTIGFFIDLMEKKPEAITKFMKDSGIDPMSLDLDTQSDYQPTARTVSDSDMELDSVLDSIRSTPSYDKTIQSLSTWDDRSQQILLDQPGLIATINEHVEAGIFDMITGEIERQRTFGNLLGMPALEAYRLVGDKMRDAGRFKSIQTRENKTASPSTTASSNKPQTQDRGRRLREVGAPRTGARPQVADFSKTNFLEMTDEEFLKSKNSIPM